MGKKHLSDILPQIDSTHNIGATDNRWANIYADTLYGDGSNLINIAADVASTLQVTVKNVSGGELTKGTVVHVSPSASPPSGNIVEVIAADYDDATKMPAVGILKETIADEAEGEAVMSGALSGIATDGFTAGDELYVGADGALTNTKPQTAGQLIQKIAVCVKSHQSNGLIKIFGAGRSNDVPLPLYIDNTNQRVGIGTDSPDFKTHLYDSGNTVLGITAGTNNYATLQFGSTSDTTRGAIEYFTNDDSLRLKTGNNSEKMRIDSSGNVGINETNPNTKLHVATTSIVPATFESSTPGHLIDLVTTNNSPTYNGIRFKHGSTQKMSVSHIADGTTKGYVQIGNNWTTGSEILVVDGRTSRVGIGTNNPLDALHVNGNILGTEASSLIKDIVTDASYESKAFYNPETFNAFAGADQWATITLTNVFQSDRTTAFTSIGAAPFRVGGNRAQLYFNSAVDEMVIEIDHTAEPLKFHAIVGMQWTATQWRCKRVKIEAYNGSAWTTGLDITDNGETTVMAKFSLDAAGIQKTKFTLGDPQNQTNFYTRISKIFGYDFQGVGSYDAIKSGTYYLEKFTDSAHYGNIYPAADSTYNLGTTSEKYSNVYADTLHGDGSNITSISYSNITGTPTIPTDFVSAANGGTFSGPVTISTDTTPGLVIKNTANSGTDQLLVVRGARNAPSAGIKPAAIQLQSFDSNADPQVNITGAEFYMEATDLTTTNLTDFEVGIRYRKDGALIDGFKIHDGEADINGNLTVSGDLTVGGTTTTLNTETIEVEDNILQLNTTQGTPDTATAATSGISIYRGDGVTQASFIFDDGDDTWDLTNNLVVAGNISAANLGTAASSAATDFVSVTGDIMTGTLVLRGQTNNYDGQDRGAYWDYDDKVALALEPAADDGATAIIFKSIGNSPSDFAYIAYDEDYGEDGVAAGENGVLLISSQNDGAGSSDHVRVKGRFVVEADTSSSDPTNAFQVKASNTTTDLFRVPRAGEAYVGSNRVFHDGYHPNADTLTTARTIAGTSFNGSANIDISYNNLTNLPTLGTAAAAASTDFVAVSGDTMTGDLTVDADFFVTGSAFELSSGVVTDFGDNTLSNIGAPFAGDDATTKTYVDSYAYSQSASDARFTKYVDLTSEVQLSSYRKSVIALCNVDNTDINRNSYSIGTLTFHRTNGLAAPIKLDIAIEKKYNTEGPNVVALGIGGDSYVDNIQYVTFDYNGTTYGGIEFYFSAAQHHEVTFYGRSNFDIFGLDYLNTNGNVVLNQEVNDSISTANVSLETDFFFNNNKVWHAGNDGSGSGLDADTLDGNEATDFVAVTGDTMTGALTINPTSGNAVLNVNGIADSFIEKDSGNHLYFANNVSDKDIIFRVNDNGSNVIALRIDGSENGNSTFSGNISASNLSGTNTGDQDLSGYALTSHNHDSDYVNVTGDTMTGQLEIALASNQLKLSTGTAGDGYLNIGHFSNGTFIGTYGDDGGVADIIRFGTHSGDERMRITSDGNVGIGTTSPDNLLEIETTDGASGSEGIFVKDAFAGTSRTVSSPDPFISIGTADFSGATSTIYLGEDATATGQETKIEYDRDSDTLGIFAKGQGTYREHVRFGNPSSTSPRTYFSGDVGIGATSPGAALHVAGKQIISTGTANEQSTDYLYVGGDGLASADAAIYLGNAGDGSGYGWRFFYQGTGSGNLNKLHFRSENLGTQVDAISLKQDGDIQFGAYGSGTFTGTTAYNLAVDSSGNIIENSANTRSVFVATSTDTTTNINATTNPPNTIQWNSEDIKDSGYTHSDATNPEQITITQAGTYKIYAAITYTTTVQRANVALEILVNDVATGARGAGGYVRSNSGHNDGTTIVEDYVTVNANDVIQIQTSQEAVSGTVTLRSGESKIIIEKLTGLTLSTTDANTLGGLGATDFVAAAGDTMTGALTINEDDNVLAFRVTGGGGGSHMASFVRDVGATGSSVNINAQSNFPQIQFVNTGNTFSVGGDTSGNFKISDNTAIGTNDRITIDNTGNVGIRTTDPLAEFHVQQANSGRTWTVHGNTVAIFENNASAYLQIISGNSNEGEIFFSDAAEQFKGRVRYEHSNDKMEFWTAGAERAFIDSSANLHVDGDVVAYSTSISDIRLKDNINTIDSALDKVKKLRGVEYTWNAGSRKNKKDLGVIAQEVEEVLPDIVREHKMDFIDEQVYKTVDYEKITAVLIEAIKEQQKQIDELKNQLDAFTD